MTAVFGIVAAILVFAVMIFLHELGHFIAARLCKVKVIEFSVGMGPKIVQKKSNKSGIIYSLRCLPIGGFTSMLGEDGEETDPHALVNRPKWQRLIVLFAGSFMNIISGIIVMFIYLAITSNVATTTVARFQDNNVSSNYGLEIGDTIEYINGERMVSYTDVINMISLYGQEPIDIVVSRNGESVKLENVSFPVTKDETTGIDFGELDFYFLGVRPSFGVLIKQTGTQSVATIKMIYKSLYQVITGKYGLNGVSGPVGTVAVISEVAKTSFSSLLYLFSFISINLGIMNLLPLPALDGGRMVFVIIEALRRKPLKKNIEGFIHLAGMAVLLIFMAVIAVFDVIKLV